MARLSMTQCIKNDLSKILRRIVRGWQPGRLRGSVQAREVPKRRLKVKAMQGEIPMRHIGNSLGNSIVEALAKDGLRVTHARRCIAECLERFATTEAAFTIDGLYTMAHAQDHRVGRATVYRTVETLVQLELVDRIAFADGAHRYRVGGHNHNHQHYITCTRCRRVAAFNFCVPEELLARVADETGFVVEGHALDIFGRCPDCVRQMS